LRLLVKKLNKERKNQAKKTNILCRGLVTAQRDFIKALDTIRFAADFYEALLDATDLQNLLAAAAGQIQTDWPQATIAFFLPGLNNYHLHMFASEAAIGLSKEEIKSCFRRELVANLSKLNKSSKLEEMQALDLHADPAISNATAISSIPLAHNGSTLGFMLICCWHGSQPDESSLNKLTAVAAGLAKAISACLSQTSAGT